MRPRRSVRRWRRGKFFSNSPALLARAAERGLGIARVPRLAVQSQLARGALVYLERELMAAPVRAFIDWMAARAPKVLEGVTARQDVP